MKGFCEKCRDIIEYDIKMENMEKIIKGRKIEYQGKVAYCSECNDEIFVHEIRDYNLGQLDNAYRKAEDLISISDIEKVLEKYQIGKRPLSVLLGWGDGTLSRYVDGDIPSKPYSDKLKAILKDEKYYREILEENKGEITENAYNKSILTVEQNNSFDNNVLDKLESAVKYLLMHNREVTPLALQKLLYFAQGFSKAFTDKYMFTEDCEAWLHGPVYRNIYEKYRCYEYNPIEEKDMDFNDINLNQEEKELLDCIIDYFGCYSGKILERMTHIEEPWRIARSGLKGSENSNRIIERELIGTYFKDVKEKYKMLNYTDIKDYSTNLFNKL